MSILDLLQGWPFGKTFPTKPNPAPPARDGRTIALRTFRDYITSLVFYRPLINGMTEPFQVPSEHFHIEWPDAIDDLKYPSMAVIPGKNTYDTIGLTAYVDEATRDVYAPNTVVQWQYEHTEMIMLEVWTNTIPERRSILAGIEAAMIPTETLAGIRFRMPDYFDQLVCFTVMESELIDDMDSARARRRARISVEMRFTNVVLINANDMHTTVQTNVDVDEDTGELVSIAIGA